MERDRDREIEILELAKGISAEVRSGRVEDVDMDEERVARIRSLLTPPPATGQSVYTTLTQDH